MSSSSSKLLTSSTTTTTTTKSINTLSLLVVSILWAFLGLNSVSQVYQVYSFATSSIAPQIGLNVLSSRPSSSLFGSGSQPDYQRRTGEKIIIDSQRHYHDVFLLSLKWTPDDRISKDVRSLWKWKDSTLGDGRDFFVPKPKTLKRLQDYLLKYCTGLQECSILSNCARLDVLCTITTPKSPLSLPTTSRSSNTSTAVENAVRIESPSSGEQLLDDVSLCFASQMLYASSNPPSMWSQLLFPTRMDRPDTVVLDRSPTECNNDSRALYNIQSELSKHWEVIRGPNDVLLYLCEVSAGMARRPRRPDRTTLFRPFSSRDAHILLQLKRTKEIISVSREKWSDKSGEMNSTGFIDENFLDRRQQVIPLLFEYALRAGKAARNPNIVPELNLIRNDILFGGPASVTSDTSDTSSSSNERSSTSNGGIADRMTELQKSRQVAAIARTKAIEPLVEECMGKFLFITDRRKEEIACLRARTFDMVMSSVDGGADEVELLWLKRKLHQPTMELRSEGRLVSYSNVEAFLKDVRDELENLRRAKAGDVALTKSD